MLAFSWWALHMWWESDELFQAESELLYERSRHAAPALDTTAVLASDAYKALESRRNKRRRMMLAEGIIFTGCLAFGLWSINHSASKQVASAQQRRNFMLSITHELKSPLAAMRLVFDTLCRRDLPREQVEKFCANGLRDAARLQSLVEDLLLAARLEDNWRPLPEPVDLATIAKDCRRGLLVRFPKANIRLDIPENLPPLQADKQGMTSVVQNLIENAVKYSPEGAPVTVRAESMNGEIRLHVADEGMGIPDSEKRAVFEKFYRLGNEETRQATGTGLGLYIVQQVVKAHQGRIVLADNRPQGTVFSVYL